MYDKIITPNFEQNGKRKHLVGYTGELYDGNILLHSQSYDTNSQAEQALDTIVFDLLTDLHEHGLVDDVPAALEAEMVSSTHLPSWQDNEPDTNSPEYRLQINRVILLTTKALHIPCRACGADHLTQHCPAIRDLLLAEPVVMVMDVEYHTISQSPFCAEPDNLCSVHDPCPAHVADAARYLAQRSLTNWQPAEILVEDLPF